MKLSALTNLCFGGVCFGRCQKSSCGNASEALQGWRSANNVPFGFYQYTVTKPADELTTTSEAINAMNLVCPYVSTAAPTDVWFAQIKAFMDRAAQTGFRVHFQLIAFQKLGNDGETLANLASIVNRFKDHPALFAWYLADEPDGQGIEPSLLQPKYDLIKKLDPAHIHVSMVFCAGGAEKFATAFDVVMVDPYLFLMPRLPL